MSCSRTCTRLSFLLLVLGSAACQDRDPTATDDESPVASAIAGRAAFSVSCAGCHASDDGLDLAFFGFTDTTIIRRALAHVDMTTARHIVAHVRTLPIRAAARDVRLFQPGARMAASDVEFATALFGADAWPSGLTTAQLRALDPRAIPIALGMPLWSDEQKNVDWMPDRPLPDAILHYRGSAALAAVAGYRAAPTVENLTRAVTALRMADRTLDNAGAPCLLEDMARVDFPLCFEVRRWTSSLVAQHLIRYGSSTPLPAALHDVWWDVGNVARKSSANGTGGLPNRLVNWAAWMYLGWSFDPSRHPSVYTGGGFRQLGLPRHATFIALRSQVARTAGTVQPYDDLRQAVSFAPVSWTGAVGAFGYRHLLERLGAGDAPRRAEELTHARQVIEATAAELARRAPVSERPALELLSREVLAALPILPPG
jgi:hypothetical protein